MTAPIPPRKNPLAGGPLPPFPASVPAPGIAASRSVLLAELSPDKKRAVWDWLKENDPTTAAFLQGSDVKAIAQAFPGSSPVLDIATVQAALK